MQTEHTEKLEILWVVPVWQKDEMKEQGILFFNQSSFEEP